MKREIIDRLRDFKEKINNLKKEISKLESKQVSRTSHRSEAEAIANIWVEELRSTLEHKFKLKKETIDQMSHCMKTLHVLSRPNNLKSSYISCLNATLKNFDDNFILPLQQTHNETNTLPTLRNIFSGIADDELSNYLKEAISCAENGHFKASIVMGWCSAIDIIQKKILSIGFSNFNSASTRIKNKTSGKFKRWNKEFNISTLAELQTIFDPDLIIILEELELIDGNQAQRLETCFQYRNHSAHPGEAPIEPAHVVSFFTDLEKIILKNKNFTL